MLCVSLPGVALEPNDEFILVIDPGHGGKDAGSVDNGIMEKDINLSVAKKVGKLVKKNLKDVKVVFTRDNDTFISLQERANRANKAKGNLFVSIHTNSVDKSNRNRTSVAGASTYALGLHRDKSNMEVARRENSVIELEKNYEQKYSGFDPQSDESYIIFEMAQKKNLSRSIDFAKEVQNQFASIGRKDRGVHQAGFWVLWATSMPAVLVELDFICNPNSAKYLASEKGSDQLAQSIAKAVTTYVNKTRRAAKAPKKEKKAVASAPSSDGASLLAASETAARTLSEAPATTQSTSTPARRRRRSESARRKSLQQSYEVASINVFAESTQAAVEEPEPEIIDDEPAPEPEKPEKQNKKRKQKKEKQQKQRTYNNKRIYIASAQESDNADSNARKRPRARVEHLAKVYKIQICTSDRQLTEGAPEFKGLTPVKYFREGNLYKYTFGESESRSEIDKMLRTVRAKIPDAFVIVTTKDSAVKPN